MRKERDRLLPAPSIYALEDALDWIAIVFGGAATYADAGLNLRRLSRKVTCTSGGLNNAMGHNQVATGGWRGRGGRGVPEQALISSPSVCFGEETLGSARQQQARGRGLPDAAAVSS